MIQVLKESIDQRKVLNSKDSSLSVVVQILVTILLIVEATRSPLFGDSKNIQVVFQTMSFPLKTLLFKI